MKKILTAYFSLEIFLEFFFVIKWEAFISSHCGKWKLLFENWLTFPLPIFNCFCKCNEIRKLRLLLCRDTSFGMSFKTRVFSFQNIKTTNLNFYLYSHRYKCLAKVKCFQHLLIKSIFPSCKWEDILTFTLFWLRFFFKFIDETDIFGSYISVNLVHCQFQDTHWTKVLVCWLIYVSLQLGIASFLPYLIF